MAKTITIIELLNKIANGEDLPKKIKIYEYVFKLHKHYYYNENVEITDLINHNFSNLLDTVEIIEEQQDIETLSPKEVYFKDGTELVYKLMYDKINEIAMKVNKLERNKQDKE